MHEHNKAGKHSKSWLKRAGIAVGLGGALVMPGTPFLTGAAATAYAATVSDPVAAVSALLGPMAQNGSFHGSVLIAQRGHILVDQGYGLANVIQNSIDTPQTKYAIGSLTQGFVAVAVMQLVNEGKVKLDAPISDYIQSQNPTTQTITVRELLTQTSGAPTTPTAPATQPGTHYAYSPLNYLLLGQIVANVTGVSCETYIEQSILTPLGLTNTGFIATDSSAIQGMSTGYDYNGSVVTAVNETPGKLIDALGMFSTTEDLYKWDQALYTGRLVPLSDIKQIFTTDPIALASLGNVGYGFGWTMTPDNAVAAEMSLDNGFASFFDRDLQNDTTVIVLSNDDYSPMQQIEAQLESIVSQAPIPPRVAASSKVGNLKHIVVNGHQLLSVKSRIAFGTTFMPLFYTEKALEGVKITQGWNGTHQVMSLTTTRPLATNVNNGNLGSGNTDVYVNGQLVLRVNTYAWKDPATGKATTYAPIYDLMLIVRALGVTTSWNGVTWSLHG